MNINTIRQKILLKGYATKSDVRQFMRCGHDKAKEIYYEIKGDVEDENKKLHQNGVASRRLLDYVGLSEKDIHKYAELERRLADNE